MVNVKDLIWPVAGLAVVMVLVGWMKKKAAVLAIEQPPHDDIPGWTETEQHLKEIYAPQVESGAFVQNRTSLTGLPLYSVGPWEKVGYVEDVAGGQIPIWRNPVDGSLDVTQSPATGGIGLATFRMHNQDWKVVI